MKKFALTAAFIVVYTLDAHQSSLYELAQQAESLAACTVTVNNNEQIKQELQVRIELLKKIVHNATKKFAKNNLKIKITHELTRQLEKKLKTASYEKDGQKAQEIYKQLLGPEGLAAKALKQASQAAQEFDYLQVKKDALEKERLKVAGN